MSTGIIELLADTIAVILGVLALAFVVFSRPAVRATLAVLVGLLAGLLLVILAH